VTRSDRYAPVAQHNGNINDGFELCGGVECSVNRVGDVYFDQMQRSDTPHGTALAVFAGLGTRAIRYSVLWERIAPRGVQTADRRDPMSGFTGDASSMSVSSPGSLTMAITAEGNHVVDTAAVRACRDCRIDAASLMQDVWTRYGLPVANHGATPGLHPH
jgi:hypothetical protein